MSQNDVTYVKKDLNPSVQRTGLILLAIGVVFGIVNFIVDYQQAILSYLLIYVFLVSISVGALFLVALEYITGAEWSTPIRRVVEFFASLIPWLIVLVIPLLLNIRNIFEWAHPDVIANDKILQAKVAYLNPAFFTIRSVLCVFVWTLFYFLLTNNSRKQDETKDQKLTKRNTIISAIFIPVFAITITVTAIDWMMSLEPRWFSTIFGVYFFSGSVLAALSVTTIAVVLLREKNLLHPAMVDDHYFSLGALLFAFINFWAYIAFSQFLLIWYANLPEETGWFMVRGNGGWMIMSMILIVVHFVVPYTVLLSQPAKKDPRKLKFTAIWILAAHLLDCYWLVMPSVRAEAGIASLILQFAFPVAAVGLTIVVFANKAKKYNLVPIGDPKLQKGLNFRL
jgi:hypothetical protein